jgi:hypothetical protein
VSTIGAGQYVRVQMWDEHGNVIQDGTLWPGANINLVFSEGPQSVARFALTRMTRAEFDELEAELGTVKEL